MRTLDRLLQRWRIRKAIPHIRRGDRVLDIGCYDGALLRTVGPLAADAVGLDPLAEPSRCGNVRILRGTIPAQALQGENGFDCITCLAVLEHIENKPAFCAACYRLLRPGGRMIVTVPRPTVDHILRLLIFFRLIDGMSLEEHHKFDINQTPDIFQQAGFRLRKKASFQLGLNCLFVFESAATAGPDSFEAGSSSAGRLG